MLRIIMDIVGVRLLTGFFIVFVFLFIKKLPVRQLFPSCGEISGYPAGYLNVRIAIIMAGIIIRLDILIIAFIANSIYSNLPFVKRFLDQFGSAYTK